MCAPLADDSAFARGDGPINTAFRRDIHIPSAVVNALRSIREVAYIQARFALTRTTETMILSSTAQIPMQQR
jgi:hypothetical protein